MLYNVNLMSYDISLVLALENGLIGPHYGMFFKPMIVVQGGAKPRFSMVHILVKTRDFSPVGCFWRLLLLEGVENQAT